MKEGQQYSYQEDPRTLTRRSFLTKAGARAIATVALTETILSSKKTEASFTSSTVFPTPPVMPFVRLPDILPSDIGSTTEIGLPEKLAFAGGVVGALAGVAAGLYPTKKVSKWIVLYQVLL